MKFKKLLSVLLTISIIICTLPIGVFNLTASAAIDGYYTYTVSNGKATLTKCNKNISGEVTIPSTLGGYPVTRIEWLAFENCSLLRSIVFPNSVTYIGGDVFSNCTSLNSITIPDSVITIVGDFSDTAYFNNENNWENNILYINNHLINAKASLSGNYTVKPGTKTIANHAFYWCKSLSSIIISNNVIKIGSSAFWNCTALTSITIPKSVLNIGDYAFNGCENIKNVYYEGSAEEWAKVLIAEGNEYLRNANIYYNSTNSPNEITSVKISKSPDKVQYIENEEELDLTGGILTVNYDGGATQEIDLATAVVTGFDNSVLGKQNITVKYGNFSTEFEIEIIPRPIAFISIAKFPNTREYILGDGLDLTGGKISVNYPEGNYETFNLTADMISGCDMNKSGYQIVTVTYKGHTTEFLIKILKNGDINGDDNINATDITLLKKILLNNTGCKRIYDINLDDKIDILDLVRLKRKLADINDFFDSDNTEIPSLNPKTELKLNTTYYHVRNEDDDSYLSEFQFNGSQLVCNALYGTDKEFAEIDTPVIYKGIKYYQYGFGGPLPKYTLTDEAIILEYGDDFLGYPEFDERYKLIVTPNLDLYVTSSSGWLFNKGDILELNYTE